HSCRGSRAAATSSQVTRPPAGRTRLLTSLPPQSRSIDCDYFALVWPLVGGSHKASADRIVPHVVPFRGVTFVAAQNVIKKSRLPKTRPFYHHAHRPLQTTDLR